ncbi:MAG: hypothetical protein GC139_07875 [Sideroxydans sp.]|nr:hypothetical protein [Sideroxydans sp.]
MRKLLVHWRWLIPLLLYSADAHAWGLYTHIYFAQLLLWAVPFTDSRYRRAVKHFPQLVLAGACLPDLSLLGKHFGTHKLNDTHRWENPRILLDNASSDAEYALALGYASHLLVDVIAHNHFVPAHEKMWLDIPLVTHVAVEWAMDFHVSTHLFARPGELLRQNEHELAQYVARHFGCSSQIARRTLSCLARADARLRSSGIPQLCYQTARLLDVGSKRRFNYYLSETAVRLGHINRILDGEDPQWDAEPLCVETTRERINQASQWELRHRIPLPQDIFAET